MDVTKPPAGHAVGLAEAIEDDHVLVELGGAVVGRVIAKRPVDFITQQKNVAFPSQHGQIPERVARVDHAGRVGRTVDEDRLGARRQGSLYHIHVDAEIGIGVYKDRFPARQGNEVGVHDEVRVENYDLVARIDRAAKSQHQPAAGAAGDEYVAMRVLVALAYIGFDLGPQLGNTLRDRVGIVPGVNGGMRGCLDRRRHVKVRLADAQVDRVLQTARQFKDFANA